MITIRARNALALCLLLMAGCSREQQDWRSAEAADTIEAYDRFAQRHPESELVTQARMRITQLEEDRDWQQAGSADTAEAYRDFMAKHPNGKWAQEARIRLDNFSLVANGEAPAQSAVAAAAEPSVTPPESSVTRPTVAVAVAPNTEPTVAPKVEAAPANTPPANALPANVPPTGAAPTVSGDTVAVREYGIQLGAYRTEAAASDQWRLFVARFGSELQGLREHIVAADTPSGRVYRLQAIVGAEAQARAICNALSKQAQPCVAVLPR